MWGPERRVPAPVLVLLLVALGVTGCFFVEEPIREHLTMRFLPDGGVAVEVEVDIDVEGLSEGNSGAADQRVREMQRALLEGRDPWSDRFALLAAERESYRWEKRKGSLARVEHRARIDDPGRLEAFFADTPVLATYQVGREWAELGLYPGPAGSRANHRQQRRLAEALETWSEAVATYLESAETLYRRLEREPSRAGVVLGHLYGEIADDTEPTGTLTADEEALLDELLVRMEKVIDILFVEPGEAYTVNELSHLVYDPFPARVTVEVPGEVLELEGFVAGAAEGTLEVPGLGLWEALADLEGRWIRPDPAVAAVGLLHAEEGEPARLMLDELLRAERHVAPAPLPGEVTAAVEERLRPEAAYRIVWRTPLRAPFSGVASPEP